MKTTQKIKLCLLLIPSFGWGQKYDTVLLDLDHTVNLVFENKILDFDIGSGLQSVNGQDVVNIVVQKTGNRLKLGAGIENFTSTNIFVETEKGYFNFVVRYSKPAHFALYIKNSSAEKLKIPELVSEETNAKTIATGTEPIRGEASESGSKGKKKEKNEEVIEAILADKIRITEVGSRTQKMEYLLSGIYLHGEHIYLKIIVMNHGKVPFTLGFDSFFIVDKKKGIKGTVSQEEKLPYLQVFGESLINAKSRITRIYVFNKFTIAVNKKVRVELWEEVSGQRKTDFLINDDLILNLELI